MRALKGQDMSDRYTPPYSITNRMVELIAEIAESVGRISGYKTMDSKPYLRRNNRIRSIHSSLAIEANSLTLDDVRSVIAGKNVIGPQREIQEVKNAYKAYDMLGKFDPYSIEDLQTLHGIMTNLTLEESGTFRTHDEGVFDGDVCIFMAPPPHLVPIQMKGLFQWLSEAKGTVHPLIVSSVFHYEFVFIHPFADGNGRMARLWHTVILYRWRSVFAYIPLESQIEKFQEQYYSAIAKCNKIGNSNAFIEFMLDMMDQVLDDVIVQVNKVNTETSEYVKRLLKLMEYDVPYTSNDIMEGLGLKSKETLRKNYLNPAIELGLIRMTIPDKPNSRNQRYVKQ